MRVIMVGKSVIMEKRPVVRDLDILKVSFEPISI